MGLAEVSNSGVSIGCPLTILSVVLLIKVLSSTECLKDRKVKTAKGIATPLVGRSAMFIFEGTLSNQGVMFRSRSLCQMRATIPWMTVGQAAFRTNA